MVEGSQHGRGGLWLYRLAGICGILASVVPIILILSAVVLSPWFRWDTNALSDIGIREEAWLFNSGLILAGALTFVFTVGLAQVHLHHGRYAKVGIVLLFVGSICVSLVGIATLNLLVLHSIFAFGYFLLAPAGIIFVGIDSGKSIKRFSVGCGIASYLAILLLPAVYSALAVKIGFAVPELVESLLISAWIILESILLLRITS